MPRHIESRLQIACVRWFRLQYRPLSLMLFAVPNGGARSLVEARIMKAEGVTAGVSDLILLVPRGDYNALCIEMKTQSKNSKQRDMQIEWQRQAEANGSKYVVCRSIEDFITEVNDYMQQPISNI